MQIWFWCIVGLSELWQKKHFEHSHMVHSCGKGSTAPTEHFPHVFIILFSEYFDFLRGFVFSCQHNVNSICAKSRKYWVEKQKVLGYLLRSWSMKPARMSRWKLPVWHYCVRVGGLSQYFMSVVTVFLGLLENSSRGVMTTITRPLIGCMAVIQASDWLTPSSWH